MLYSETVQKVSEYIAAAYHFRCDFRDMQVQEEIVQRHSQILLERLLRFVPPMVVLNKLESRLSLVSEYWARKSEGMPPSQALSLKAAAEVSRLLEELRTEQAWYSLGKQLQERAETNGGVNLDTWLDQDSQGDIKSSDNIYDEFFTGLAAKDEVKSDDDNQQRTEPMQHSFDDDYWASWMDPPAPPEQDTPPPLDLDDLVDQMASTNHPDESGEEVLGSWRARSPSMQGGEDDDSLSSPVVTPEAIAKLESLLPSSVPTKSEAAWNAPKEYMAEYLKQIFLSLSSLALNKKDVDWSTAGFDEDLDDYSKLPRWYSDDIPKRRYPDEAGKSGDYQLPSDDQAILSAMADNQMHDYNTSIEYKTWELKEMLSDTQRYPRDCTQLIKNAPSVFRLNKEVSKFDFVFQYLDRLIQCDTHVTQWDYDRGRGSMVVLWDLFYTAERYFVAAGIDRPEDQRKVMGRLAYMVYQLPRHGYNGERPWPMDVLRLLSDYVTPSEIPQLETTPSADAEETWISFLLAVHHEAHREIAVRSGSSAKSIVQVVYGLPQYFYGEFDRALGRLHAKARDVLSLYFSYSNTEWKSSLRYGHRTFLYVNIFDYYRVVKLMQSQLTGEEYEKALQRLVADAVHFGIVPDLTSFRRFQQFMGGLVTVLRKSVGHQEKAQN